MVSQIFNDKFLKI